MKTKFSVVLPVHNEERYLPYSLPSILNLNPDELIILFDRCTDYSYEVAADIIGSHKDVAQFIELNEGKGFRLPLVRRRGYALAKHDIILATAADIILDQNVLLSLSKFNEDKVALVSLGCMDYPVSPRNLVGNLAQTVMSRAKHPRFYGPFLFRRDRWREVDETMGYVSEDAPLWLALLEKYEMRFYPSKCVHLRSDESWQRNYDRGRDYWRVARRNPFFALASSVVMLRPSLAVGYIHERFQTR